MLIELKINLDLIFVGAVRLDLGQPCRRREPRDIPLIPQRARNPE